MRAASLQTFAMSAPENRSRVDETVLLTGTEAGRTCNLDVHLPEKPGVRAAIFLAKASLFRSTSSFRGRRWTLKMDARPLISGRPENIC